jgi:hypothetical protein
VELATGIDGEDLPYLIELVGGGFASALVETSNGFDEG